MQALEQLQRLKGLALARILLAVLASGVGLLAPAGQAGRPWMVLGALGAAAASNLLLFFVPVKPRPLRLLAHAFAAVDIALVTFLVYLSGWAGSPYLPLGFAVVLGAAFLLGKVWAVVYASGMVLALCAVTGIYRAAALTGEAPPLLPAEADAFWKRDLVYYLGHLLLETGALYAVAILGGVLVQRLLREEVMIREVLDLMGEGVVAVDQGGRLLVMNPAAQRCLKAGSPLPGSLLLATLDPAVQAWLGPLLKAEAPTQAVQTVAAGSGPALPLAVQAAPLGVGRARRGAVVMLTDLTREREAASAERRAERLEATARLSMGIAHEIRNPLASIRGAAQELLKGPDARLTAMILRESDRLDRILGEFLTYARLAPPRLGRCDLEAVLRESLEVVRSRPEAAELSWEFRPPGPGALQADSEQLRQLFLNLLINAVQASGGGGRVALEAAWTSRAGIRGARVSVSDTGPGVSDEARARLFEPFFTTKPDGTGLGLAVSARVAAFHGGEIALAASGAGARFEVWLPERGAHGGS